MRDKRDDSPLRGFLRQTRLASILAELPSLAAAARDETQFIRREGLRQEVIRTGLHRVYGRSDRGVAGNDGNHQVRIDLPHAGDYLQAVPFRHLQVDEKQLRLRVAELREARDSAFEGL